MKLEGKRFSRGKTTFVGFELAFAFAFAALAVSTTGCATPAQQTNLTSAGTSVETTTGTRPAPRVGKSQRAESAKPVAGRDLRHEIVNPTDDDLEPKRTTTNDVSSSHRRSGTFGAWK
ncbi:hypothetical protein AKJ09_03046 [Labilithrix luteola]|uniref:Lipoprotein n=1 Tax=Labilithrix luteola TaxID=1391654 RepID=A0A0K1PS82_9BACT|nr:hypothetical protein [Labilithrix luteola]AKU96382.1 hypothetical protein AKJ09_03046 [Labilithrix luteola]